MVHPYDSTHAFMPSHLTRIDNFFHGTFAKADRASRSDAGSDDLVIIKIGIIINPERQNNRNGEL
jgi:hypothetical protein